MRYFAFPIAFFLALTCLQAQTVRLEGVVQDEEGEWLPFANVLVVPDSLVVPADTMGRFAITVLPGQKDITISYAGQPVLITTIPIHGDTLVIFNIQLQIRALDEVAIKANRYSSEGLVQSTRTGTTMLTSFDLNAIPSIGGEADVLKTLQLLPGMVRGMDGSTDIFVRGGAADQNLVLLDGAPIYNPSHLFGFLSVFNSDIIEKAEVINGGFPANYGGRLSSILDISSKNHIASKPKVSGSIGLLASRLYIEQPLVKDKVSIWITGRRTYVDYLAKVINEEIPYFFYDFNGKITYKLSAKDLISFSHYNGKDIFDMYRDRNKDGKGVTTGFRSGNASQSLQWTHQYGQDWQSQVNLFRSSFQYNVQNAFAQNELTAYSDIEDIGAKFILNKYSKVGRFATGLEWVKHTLNPNVVNTNGHVYGLPEESTTPRKTLHEMAAYGEYDWELSPKFLLNAGFRAAWASVDDKAFFAPEPRAMLRYALNENNALKVSYSRMTQFIHRVSNSAISMPTDIWYPTTDNIQPQKAHQYSLAWNSYKRQRNIFVSAEAYYKDMQNQIDYKAGTNLFLNPDFRSQLIQGDGKAYGLELLLRKEAGKLTGWLSYALSWSWRRFEEISHHHWFLSRYDRRHNGAIALQYRFHDRWSASVVWEYISGARFTPIVGGYVTPAPTIMGLDVVPVFTTVNEVKLADTHRLDLGIKYNSKPGTSFQWQWFIGVNNAYNRTNPIGIFIEEDDAGNFRYIQPGLFGLLPFISYQFEF